MMSKYLIAFFLLLVPVTVQASEVKLTPYHLVHVNS